MGAEREARSELQDRLDALMSTASANPDWPGVADAALVSLLKLFIDLQRGAAPDIPTYFSGVLAAVTDDGRLGIVELEQENQGIKFAVIRRETKGLVALMEAGNWGRGVRVCGWSNERGPDALFASSVEALP